MTQLKVFVVVLDVNDNAPKFPFTTKEQDVEEVSRAGPELVLSWARVRCGARGLVARGSSTGLAHGGHASVRVSLLSAPRTPK